MSSMFFVPPDCEARLRMLAEAQKCAVTKIRKTLPQPVTAHRGSVSVPTKPFENLSPAK